MKKGTVLAVIPARGGSKGLPGKNIRPLCGKPLIAWTIEQAKACPLIDTVIVSTDSPEIAAVSEEYGIQVPHLRPAHLATDTATSVDVLLHELEPCRLAGRTFEYIALLEPTSPLRKQDDFERAISLALENPDADGVISLGEVHTEHPSIVKRINEKGFLDAYMCAPEKTVTRRQQLDAAYFPYGVIYMVKTSVLESGKRIYADKMLPFFIERWQNYEVDDLCDFICIEAVLQAHLRGEL